MYYQNCRSHLFLNTSIRQKMLLFSRFKCASEYPLENDVRFNARIVLTCIILYLCSHQKKSCTLTAELANMVIAEWHRYSLWKWVQWMSWRVKIDQIRYCKQPPWMNLSSILRDMFVQAWCRELWSCLMQLLGLLTALIRSWSPESWVSDDQPLFCPRNGFHSGRHNRHVLPSDTDQIQSIRIFLRFSSALQGPLSPLKWWLWTSKYS